ncbi:hypothetical protein T02_494 [Trichinella nativa]|uniref:Secreted protein n=1 Tax=Trichinella nativa TaxID=6335 RepID=A0A0V1LRP8_9BILA|nr:hypothetical protein T02_494 [Trichinella nativa]
MKKNSTPAVWNDHFALLYFARILLLSSTAAVHDQLFIEVPSISRFGGEGVGSILQISFCGFCGRGLWRRRRRSPCKCVSFTLVKRMFTGISFLFTLHCGDNEPDYDTGRARKECASELGLID